MIYPWGDSRRYHAYSSYLKSLFGTRVQKLSLHAGFTCPNRDGRIGYGGCTYCDNSAFNPSYCDPSKSIVQQLEEGMAFHRWRYRKAVSYMAYSFANFSMVCATPMFFILLGMVAKERR